MKINFSQNQIFISHKSESCMSKSGNPLSEYRNLKKAQESAAYQYAQNGQSFTPYLCQKCGFYHLKPTEFYCVHTSGICSCTDHNGNKKSAYATAEDAEKMARIRAASGIQLYVYNCPSGNGFHLTSRNEC